MKLSPAFFEVRELENLVFFLACRNVQSASARIVLKNPLEVSVTVLDFLLWSFRSVEVAATSKPSKAETAALQVFFRACRAHAEVVECTFSL